MLHPFSTVLAAVAVVVAVLVAVFVVVVAQDDDLDKEVHDRREVSHVHIFSECGRPKFYLPSCSPMRPFIRFMSSTSASTTTIPRLPRLPVPDLRKTLDRYLRSIQPFLLEDEARGGLLYEQSYVLRVRWAQDFEKTIGVKAQEALVGHYSLFFLDSTHYSAVPLIYTFPSIK